MVKKYIYIVTQTLATYIHTYIHTYIPTYIHTYTHTFSRAAIMCEEGWSILKMLSPLRRAVSCSFSCPRCFLISEIKASASEIGTEAENGPFDSKSSARTETDFLNSSADCSRPVLNFSYRVRHR